jgi:hypothetical protein
MYLAPFCFWPAKRDLRKQEIRACTIPIQEALILEKATASPETPGRFLLPVR